jgi:phenylpropionate dioxygenase-like ring-hydroxylating dioxygenase large terminal subunit
LDPIHEEYRTMTEQRRANMSGDPARSPTLPGWAYTDPALFEREKSEIFYKSWQYAGWIGDLAEPGSYLTAQILDQHVVILRGDDGVLRGFYNVCRHRAHTLLAGCGRTKSIVCPYHAWSYGIDGSLRSARGPEPADGRLPTSGPAINANWKIVIDNCLECYHCRPVHPAFRQLIDMDDFRVRAHAFWASLKGHPRDVARWGARLHSRVPDSSERGPDCARSAIDTVSREHRFTSREVIPISISFQKTAAQWNPCSETSDPLAMARAGSPSIRSTERPVRKRSTGSSGLSPKLSGSSRGDPSFRVAYTCSSPCSTSLAQTSELCERVTRTKHDLPKCFLLEASRARERVRSLGTKSPDQ